MEYKQLGNTGVMVSEVGLGAWKYKGVWNRYVGGLNSEPTCLTPQKCTVLKMWLERRSKISVIGF